MNALDPRRPDPQAAAPPPVAKWKVPLIVAGIVVGLLAAGALFVQFTLGWIKGTGAHKEAIAAAVADARVRDRLGTPITEDWWIEGRVSLDGGSGSSNVESTLRGPRGTATLVDAAWEAQGLWHHSSLRVVFPGALAPLDLCDSAIQCDPAPVAP